VGPQGPPGPQGPAGPAGPAGGGFGITGFNIGVAGNGIAIPGNQPPLSPAWQNVGPPASADWTPQGTTSLQANFSGHAMFVVRTTVTGFTAADVSWRIEIVDVNGPFTMFTSLRILNTTNVNDANRITINTPAIVIVAGHKYAPTFECFNPGAGSNPALVATGNIRSEGVFQAMRVS
jgi:hypothetical protein